MKANELMLNDYVLYKGKIARVLKLVAINIIDVSTGIGTDWRPHEDVNPNEVCPVPLTAEILEKNGLKPDTAEDAYKYCYRIDSVSIVECYANAGGRYRGIISFGDTRLRITLMFVHQLQHALRLCGIEKEIEL